MVSPRPIADFFRVSVRHHFSKCKFVHIGFIFDARPRLLKEVDVIGTSDDFESLTDLSG